ncbi:MAG: hypothetical protein ACXW30_06530 [Micavibrio sp.]
MHKQSSALPFYAALSLLCASVMALQILQSRLFSVVTWYHLSFLVISIAMFGLTLGALKIYRLNEAESRRDLNMLSSNASFLFSVTTLVALAIHLTVPIVHTNIISILVTLPFVAGATAMNYYYAGQIVTLCLTRSDRPIGLVYGADLLGASLGCLGALFLMQQIDSPTAIVFIAALIMFCGILFDAQRPESTKTMKLKASVMAFLLMIGTLNLIVEKPFIYTLWTKGRILPQTSINHEEWNAISRVTVLPVRPSSPAYLWGPSSQMPETKVDYQYLAIDGDASTPITRFDGKSWDQLKYLEYDVTNLAYFLPNLESGAIIGVGGGRDLLSARYFGVKKTVALDVNATQVNLLTKNPDYISYTNLATLPDSRIINSEARSWLSRSTEKFDIIQMSMIDTWASTGAGAFALSENSLYTTGALRIFLNNLNPNGVLTVSRWYTAESYSDIGRLISMSVSTLLDMGVKEPWKNIYIAQSARISTFILGRDALTPEQLESLNAKVRDLDYTIIASPEKTPENPLVAKIYKAETREQLEQSLRGLPFDLTPSTDMRPFFFNQTYVTKPLEVIKQALSMSMQAANARGHAVATLNLYLIILLSLGMAALLLLPPLKQGLPDVKKGFIAAGSAYFILIGVGFMLVEITLMQIMSMFLGHPVYGLGIVLFSLILSTGIGSMISEFVPVNTVKRAILWLGLLVLYTVLLASNIETLLNQFIQADLIVRALLCVSVILPEGILLGFGFPTGIRLVQTVSSKMSTWFWAVNGAAGVVASALAILISIGWGLDKTMLLAGLLYAGLAVPTLLLLRNMTKST